MLVFVYVLCNCCEGRFLFCYWLYGIKAMMDLGYFANEKTSIKKNKYSVEKNRC